MRAITSQKGSIRSSSRAPQPLSQSMTLNNTSCTNFASVARTSLQYPATPETRPPDLLEYTILYIDLMDRPSE